MYPKFWELIIIAVITLFLGYLAYSVLSAIEILGFINSVSIALILLLPALAFLLITSMIDKAGKTKTRYLAFMSIGAVLTILIFSNPIENYLTNATGKVADQLVPIIEEFNQKKGKYPSSLDELEKWNKPNIKNFSIFKSRISYYPFDDSYSLSYEIGSGYNAHWNKQEKVWINMD